MKKGNYKRLGEYIEQIDIRNRNLRNLPLSGVSVEKNLIPSVANTNGTDFTKYKILEKKQFVYIADTSRRGDKIAFALNNKDTDVLVSSAYTTFRIKNENELLPEYLMMWAKRPEFDRYARYMSHGSVREIFSWEEMCNVLLPVPPISEQRRIVNEYQTVERLIANNEALIQKLEETAQAIYHHTFVEGIDEEKLPEGWRMGTLTDVASFKVGGDRPKTFSESKTEDCNIPIYSNGVEAEGLYGFTNKAAVTKDSITISARGNVGTCFLRRHPYTGIVRLISVIPINEDFLYYLLFNLSSRNLTGDGSAQSQITIPQLENEDILIPDNETMEVFYKRANIIYNNIDNLKQETHHLRTLLTLLTSKLS